MKKVISLLILILCAMLIITGCDPATTNPGTGGNTTLPSNPDDNPLIPDDKPSNDANLPAPTDGHTTIINNLYAKFQENKEKITYTFTAEKIFKDSVYKATEANEESFTANGNLILTSTDFGSRVNGKIEIDIENNNKSFIYEAKNFDIIEFPEKNIKGELKVNGKPLSKEEILENNAIITYFSICMDYTSLSNLSIISRNEGIFSSDEFSFQDVLIGSISNNARATDALIIKDNKDTLQIGYIIDMSNSENPTFTLDYVSVNGKYISVENSPELKETLFGFASMIND